MFRRAMTVLVLLSVPLAGCRSHGPGTIRSTSFNYNEAIVSSWNEQLLLNIVRLRYRDTPFFLEVGSVSSTYTFSASAGAKVDNPTGGRASSNGLSLGAGYSEKPTITYSPLRGEEFAKQLLVPTRISTLFLLAQSGWSATLVFRCCVERFGALRNDPGIETGAASEQHARSFRRAAELLQLLRLQGHLQILVEPTTGELEFRMAEESAGSTEVEELMELIGLAPQTRSFSIQSFFAERGEGQVGVLTRSVLSILYSLSRSVDPESATTEFAVRVTERAPERAFVAVEYQGRWYSIDKDDQRSKELFGLLSYLLAINSGDNTRAFGPIQTLSVN